jgi:hypothetical protein
MIRLLLDLMVHRVVRTRAMEQAEDRRYRAECSDLLGGMAIIDAPDPEPDPFVIALMEELEEAETVAQQPAIVMREPSPLLVHPLYLHRPEVQFA